MWKLVYIHKDALFVSANRMAIFRGVKHKNRYITLKVSKGLPQQAEVAQGVPGRLRPRIFLTFWYYKGGRSSAIRTGRLYTRRNP